MILLNEKLCLQKAIVSEKSMKLASTAAYTFVVAKTATKPQIARAVTEQFKVTVLSVRTINVKGEIKMQKRARRNYMTTGFKKAIVQLKKGQVIPLFEAPKEEATVTTADEPQVIKEKRNLLRSTKVKIEKSQGAATQKGVLTGKGGDK